MGEAKRREELGLPPRQKKIELSNISLSINKKISLRSYWVDSAVSIDVKDYF